MVYFDKKRKLTDYFSPAIRSFSCPREFFLMGTGISSVRDAAQPYSFCIACPFQ